MACGVKESGAPDLALIATADGLPVPAALVVTANRAKAAPVLTSLAHFAASGGRSAGVILNSGNANAATGTAGREAARGTCAAAARELGCSTEEVLVCSTGLIGVPLRAERILAAIPALAAARAVSGDQDAAQAILTTDTVTKQTVVRGDGWCVGGMAKGAAMLSPRLESPHATMLAVLTTDAAADSQMLQAALNSAVRESFNALDVDGATSTNDTVIVMASGSSEVAPSADELTPALTKACANLADQMAADAEGATKRVRVTVIGAASDHDAAKAARAVARSELVQCSLYGGDPYWGRVVSELGASGAAFDPERVSVSYGGVVVCRHGIACEHDRVAVAGHMSGREIGVIADLGLGAGRSTVTTTDLSPEYIAENMRTS